LEFFKLIESRYSVRSYQPRPVEEEKLAKVLRAAQLAPTAANRQPFRFIVIHTKGREEELRRIYNREWFVSAPIVIAACAVFAEGWQSRDGKNYSEVDTTIAMDHLILSAHDLGLGTCWVAAFDVPAAKEILGLPADVDPIVFTPLGYPADKPKDRMRKGIGEIVRYQHW
jgi:nitroreductase